jgi:two-component system chemotaxis response regulator CheB
MTEYSKKTRVLVVDDSRMYRKILLEILGGDSSFEVVAEATNGKEAVKYASLLKPDVISMDMMMPEMDGIEATQIIMQETPVPIVIASSVYKSDDIHLAIRELEAGAVVITPKPEAPGIQNYEASAAKYRQLLKIMSEVKVIRRKKRYMPVKSISATDTCNIPSGADIIAIGASAGGPEALKIILQTIYHPARAPIVVAQHMDWHFTEGYAEWLDQMFPSGVKTAEEGELLQRGNIYITPGNRHMEITQSGIIRLKKPVSNNEKWNGHVPSIDLLFKSLTKYLPSGTIAILLSGMGRDGAEGLKALKNAGAYTMIQSKESSLIYGMPAEAEKLDAACRILSPEEIGEEINKITK